MTTIPEGWQPPQQEYTCEHCDGRGYIVRGISVYEHGCGFPHDDVEEIPCKACGGAGGYIADAEPNSEDIIAMNEALAADGEKLLALTGEDHGPWSIENTKPDR